MLKQNELTTEQQTAIDLVALWFKNDDREPFIMTAGQADIFNTIFLKRHQRNQIITSTQYGKSETVAMALIMRAITFQEDWLILAGDEKKTKIIMGKVIDHLFDNSALEAQINMEGITSAERLKHERSRDRITFKNGGEIRSMTADARNRKRVKESLTGQGARNIVQDESALIMDDLQAMVMRMLGGFQDAFLLKIGNPFYRNHFFRTWHSDKYYKIFIDYRQALSENRYSETFIEEMQAEPFFDVLYACQFPSEDELLEGGYRRLITDELLEQAFVSDDPNNGYPSIPEKEGMLRLGCDFAGGGNDRSAYVLRTDNLMWIESVNRSANLMDQVSHIQDSISLYGLDPEMISTDRGGLGQGVGDRLHELELFTNNVMFGETADDKERFKNIRAEMYYRLQQWLLEGGKIVYDEAWYELLVVNYKTDTERKFQIQPKEELKKRLKEQGLSVTSPDIADGGALTFAGNDMITEDDFELI